MSSIRRPARWQPRVDRRDAVDLAVALLAAASATAATLNGNYDEGPLEVVVVTGLLVTLPLAVRRRMPLTVFLVVLGALLAQAMVLGTVEGVGPFFGLLISAYTLAAHRPLLPAAGGLLLVPPVMVIVNWRQGLPLREDLEFILGLVGGLWLAGRVVWSRQQLVQQLATQADELRRTRDAEARAAVAEERNRIARDVHDLVAHSVTVMVVQAETAEALLPQQRPDLDRSREALQAVQRTGRATLAQLRQVLTTLSSQPPPNSMDGYPTDPGSPLHDITMLVDEVRQAGLDLTLELTGDTSRISRAHGGVIYRLLQEALTNTLRHAGRTSVHAHLDVGATEVRIDVVDAGPTLPRGTPVAPVGSGRGLVGMGQRVQAVGGTLDVGPHGRGFRVQARLPLQTLARS